MAKTEESDAPPATTASELPATDAPVGPSSEEEAAFLAQERELGNVTPALMHVEKPSEEQAGELPPMEDLVKRIPGPARELLEELFRARFVTVKRVPSSALK